MAILRKSRIQIAKQDIINFFKSSGTRTFTPSEISEILNEQRGFWRLATRTSASQFISFLLQEANLQKVEIAFPSLKITRYIWEDTTAHELALSLFPKSYFTHYTAMYLHDLTEQIPKTIYVNVEQQLKPYHGGSIEQDRIDRAFRGAPRVSKATAQYRDYKICLLHGMSTGQLGVSEIQSPDEGKIRATDVERTLIDLAVRPFYSGGVFEVLKAYRLAKEKVSVNTLAAFLKKMNYVYPYHQAIGFYLEKSGAYRDSQIKIFQNLEMKFDFYLTYQMKERSYSKKWRLYYPKGL